ncbi:MAG: AhpC/TSA family protein [Bacteroidales bacterium]|nr:AhpC/TSA family protein [Bacteroidales bacterium]
MNKRHLVFALALLVAVFCACKQLPEYCIVKGSVTGLKDGTRLELQDEYDHFKVIATTRVKDGAYEFRPRIPAPTHVYLYSTWDQQQLKDFLLEPGTIVADIDATDDEDWTTFATGTPSNDLYRKIDQLERSGNMDAADALRDSIVNAGETGILALYLSDGHGVTAAKGQGVLDRLSEDIAAKPYVAEMRETMTRRARTEPAPEGSESPNCFIDMEFPDVDGNMISLSSVVNNPANRYVLLDFWATWCSSCRESIPKLKALYEQYHDRGLEIFSVSEDESENNWKKFLPESGMTWVNVRDVNAGRRNSKSMWNEYALFGIPGMMIIDGENGAIIFRDRTKDIAAAVHALFKE